MKKLLVVMTLLGLAVSMNAGSRDDLWKKVDEAVKKGLPATAITNLEPIIQAAMKEKAYAEAVRAIGQKIALEGNIQGNKPEEKIVRLQEVIAKSPREMVPVLDTLLAHWYWHYFQQNRWRFMQRTQTASAPGNDFTTWDLPRLFAEVDRYFQSALSADNYLKSVPISAWNDLLEKGTMPDTYRPTLYDFLAQEALGFYTSGEQAAAKPEGAFEISAESPVFDAPEGFLSWKPVSDDTNSAPLRAIAVYQQLLRFHQSDPPPRAAFAHVDLERLTWGWNVAFGEDKPARYKKALERFVSDHADFEITAIAMERHGRVLFGEGDYLSARKIAARGVQLFPASPGGKLCHNLIQDIDSKSLGLTTERVWNAPWPKITVRYRNLEVVHFRAIAYTWETFLEQRRNRPEYLNQEERKEILSRAPVLEWSEKLPLTADYKERVFVGKAPESLKPGYYFIAASVDPSFKEGGNMVSLADVFVSDLALVTRNNKSVVEGFVLQANSGEPIQGADVSFWYLDQNGKRVQVRDQVTDADGFFSHKPEGAPQHGWLVRARHNGHMIASAQDLYIWGHQNHQTPGGFYQTTFFTDRAIYRPGQTISYKGICLMVDQAKDNYEVVKGEVLEVIFKDSNGKEIAREKKQANDYGSFSGSFTAPRDRLMGQMHIEVQGRAAGSAHFRVEEYKRPKFEVTLDAPRTAARLGGKVNLVGRAMGYTGAAVDGAKVQYRITREVRMPWWWGWRYGGGGFPGGSQEIAHGVVTTKTDGSFEIEFVAKPDPSVPEKNEPTFVYSIVADVTDSAGETRSDQRSIRVGYTALEAMMSSKEFKPAGEPFEIRVETKSLDGEPQVAEGSVKVYALEAPAQVMRLPIGGEDENLDGRPDQDLSNPNYWPLGKLVAEKGFTSDTNGIAKLSFTLPVGAFRAMLETQDRFGKKVTGMLPIQVLDPAADKLAIKIPHLFIAPDWVARPGQDFMVLWGTGYDSGRAFVEVEHRGKMIQRYWTKPGQTQQQVKVAVTEAMRGGFTVHLTQVRENRSYLQSTFVSVPWENKELELKWEHFVSKLTPGQKETWSLIIQKSAAAAKEAAEGTPEKAAAELVATLYDESLDAFAPQSWPGRFGIFRHDSAWMEKQFANLPKGFNVLYSNMGLSREPVRIAYRSFPASLTVNFWRFAFANRRYSARGMDGATFAGGRGETTVLADAPVAGEALALYSASPAAAPMAKAMAGVAVDKLAVAEQAKVAEPGQPPGRAPDLDKVTARKNLNETAFFFPHLTSDSNGVVRITFSMPEALTKWRFLGFAHDTKVRSGFLEGHAVTAKDIMVQPNPPRFLRENDTIEFTVKVSNQSERQQDGQVKLTFNDALTGQSADQLLRNTKLSQQFSIPAKESRTFSWRISVPVGCGFLTYKAVAASASVSDGEEGAIPVLSSRVFITESLPLPIRGPATKKFEFTKLVKSGSSRTLQHQGLTVQMVSQPAWYAVLALPYLMEYPYECSEQIFNRLYANSLARSIASSDPKIQRVFEQWRNTPALDSPLEKNQDLKSVALEETPWLRQAKEESQARRNVGLLFDDNRLNSEVQRTFEKLTQMQLQDGAWPWFPGGLANDYITLYITTGFGRMRHLGVDVDTSPARRSLQRLDNWMREHYEQIKRSPNPELYVPSSTDALYLYGRSFFLKDMPIAQPHKEAIEFFLNQSREFWLKTANRQTQGHLALALNRWGGDANKKIAQGIVASLRERSVTNEEMGMFWRESELSWWWYRAPIETQALMIEAFDEVAQDSKAVEECKVWLLKQKQTQDWKTTKATADAVYALLLRGRNLLSSDALVEVKVGNLDVTPKEGAKPKGPAASKPEPGTGFYEVKFSGDQVKPRMGEITVKKVDQGVAWGSAHWQYFEDISKVTPHEGTPLKLRKTLFVKKATSRGAVLEAVKDGVSVGDELVVRVELRTDRDMEYVHLKDQRGSGTEPVNVLSSYKYQDGLRYYESTRDTASHFFIDYLPKGTYVFEYSTRVQLRGSYQTGVAEIQCMYAPEFNSHSESLPLKVK